MTSQKITIDPVTRVEGHGRVTIRLNEEGNVKDAFFHIVEFRGFERFIQGHPYWEAPVLVQRLCGICPVSHHIAAAKAIDQIVGIDPEDLPPTATKLRKLLHYGQVFQSHALHFFYLAAPDLLFGADAPPEKRNVVAVATADKELAKKGILMRKFGQELIKAIAGKRIHGISALPGGVHRNLTPEQRDYFLNDDGGIPSVDTMIKWATETIAFIKNYHEVKKEWLDLFARYPSGHMGMVTDDGALDLYDGRLRAVNSMGKSVLPDIHTDDYIHYFSEHAERWSYMKFPFLNHIGREKGWNRVGPLARMNICDYIPTPLAEKERQDMFAFTGGKPINSTMYYHWARLIEILYCGEVIKDLLNDEDILGTELKAEGTRRHEGIGIIEAPRGTLIHHYRVDAAGMITKCNLIVSTTHNNEPMNQAVKWVAKNVLSSQPKITEGMLNQVEVAIRAYDPCLSCATHALGKMPLEIQFFDHEEKLINVHRK